MFLYPNKNEKYKLRITCSSLNSPQNTKFTQVMVWTDMLGAKIDVPNSNLTFDSFAV